MVTIENLVATVIKDILNKNQIADSIITVAFMNKARNFPIQPKIIEEKIENGALIKKCSAVMLSIA